MDTISYDVESFWSNSYSLTKLSPLEYVLGPEFETISCSIKLNDYPTDVFFGHDDVAYAFKSIKGVIEKGLLLAHNNSGFDSYVAHYVFGLKPKMWGCTLAMARPLHTKTVGLSLAKLVQHYGLGVKNNAVLMQTRGKHLADFTPAEIEDMKVYNRADTDQCYALFKRLRPSISAAEMWQIDALTRMRVEPKFQVDTQMLEVARGMERHQKQTSVLRLAQHLRKSGFASEQIGVTTTVETLEEAVRVELASAPKFAALLESLGVTVPMKPSPTGGGKQIHALAKTDEAFTDLQQHDNPIVAAAARARLAVKSTLLETRIDKFLTAASLTSGMLPVPLRYCGADTTGRDSGEEYNCQNLPRIGGTAKISDVLRNCMKAPKGFRVIVADQSGIELRVNHFLWKVQSSMELYAANPEADLYRAGGAIVHRCTPEEVTKAQRHVEKIKNLGLGFGAGAGAFVRVAKTMGGLDMTLDESQGHVDAWRNQYAEIVRGWKLAQAALGHVHAGSEIAVDPWGMVTTCSEGLRLPSGRTIRYPDLRQEEGAWPDGRHRKDWVYAHGRYKAFLTGPKTVENIVQSLARDSIFDCSIDFYRSTRLRPALRVHDELVYVVPEPEAVSLLAELQRVMRAPPRWWPELIVHSEGDHAASYGAAK